jgi:glycosyltransferase involved in cell wall biosynthesis
MKSLTIVLPVYNEEKSIGETVSFFRRLLQEHTGYELVIVNDGSTDATPEALANITTKSIQVIHHSKNRGYGAALKSGVKFATHNVIAITDADGSYPNDRIPELFDYYSQNQADMVIGSRTGSNVHKSGLRRLGKFFLRKLTEYLSETRIPDFNSGFRIIKKELIQKARRYLPEGFSFTTTLSLYALSNQCVIEYIPIDYHKRIGRSKIKPFSDTLSFVQLIVRTVMFFNPLKVFLPLSAFFIFLSFAVLLISYFMGTVMDITTILLFVTGLHMLALGLIADLIDKRLSK